MARAPKMQRRRCPLCARQIAVHERGQLYRHGDAPRLLCPGSGFTPETLAHRVDAMMPPSTSRGSTMSEQETTTTTTETTEVETTEVEVETPKPDDGEGDEQTDDEA